MLSDRERCIYRSNPLIEVICQLRFPTILSISAREPADFQEGIRQHFPQYKRLQHRPEPHATDAPARVPVKHAHPSLNYQHLGHAAE